MLIIVYTAQWVLVITFLLHFTYRYEKRLFGTTLYTFGSRVNQNFYILYIESDDVVKYHSMHERPMKILTTLS